jgi:hypothetical protein
MIGYLFVPFAYILIPGGAAGGAAYSKWHIMTLGTPAAIGIMLLAGVIHIGLMGRGMSDAHREWWGRLGGWLLLCALCWLFLFLVAIYFPAGLRRLFDWESHRTGHPITFTGVVVWILSTAYGVLFGKSENTSKWIGSEVDTVCLHCRAVDGSFCPGFSRRELGDGSELADTRTSQRPGLRCPSSPALPSFVCGGRVSFLASRHQPVFDPLSLP